jgi:hypothetical protein
MTITAQVRELSSEVQAATRKGQFLSFVRYLLLASKGSAGGQLITYKAAVDMALKAGVRGPVVEALKSVVSAGGLGGGTSWGSALADLRILVSAFDGSLSNAGIFDALRSSMVPIPVLNATLGAVTAEIAGYVVGENSAKQISKLSLVNTSVAPRKGHAAIVCSNELLRIGGPAAMTLLNNELTLATTAAVDKEFIENCLLSGVVVGTSSGSTAEAARADVANLLTQVPLGKASKPFLITTARIAAMWSCMGTTGSTGQSAFPDMSPQGGKMCGLTVLVGDEDTLPRGAIPAGTVILVDASGVAAGATLPEPSVISEGSVVQDSSPDSPMVASTAIESLWQLDKSAIRIERWFSCVKLRTAAVAAIFNSNSYSSGFSPP